MFPSKLHTAIAIIMLAFASQAASAAERSAGNVACAAPEFPTRWIDEGREGQVTVAFLVGSDGKVAQSRVVESSGDQRLDRASERAARRCTLQPSARDGSAAPAWTRVRYTWTAQ